MRRVTTSPPVGEPGATPRPTAAVATDSTLMRGLVRVSRSLAFHFIRVPGGE
jgi:hypothetical protein